MSLSSELTFSAHHMDFTDPCSTGTLTGPTGSPARTSSTSSGSNVSSRGRTSKPDQKPQRSSPAGTLAHSSTLQPRASSPPLPGSAPAPPSGTHTATAAAALLHPDPAALWEQVTQLHESARVGYLAAIVQLRPELSALAASGERDAAFSQALKQLYVIIDKHHDRRKDIALPLFQAAQREAMTTLSVSHEVTLSITLQLAVSYGEDRQHEQELRQWRWLQPRAAQLTCGWATDGFHIRLRMARCLQNLRKESEVLSVASEALHQRRASHGDEDEGTLEALLIIVLVDWQCTPLPDSTLIPLLERLVTHVKRPERVEHVQQDLRATYVAAELRFIYMALQRCCKAVGDWPAAARASQQWVRIFKRMPARADEEYIRIRVTHGTNLALAGLQARAVSVVTQTIQDAIRMYGTDHQATVMAAASLARTFVTLEHYDTASDIYTRAWEAAGRCLLPNDRTHTLLFKEFAVSLRHAGRFTAYCALLVQAEDRGLPVHDCLNTLI